MREAQKLQRGQAAQPQSRPSPRHKQPPRVRAQGCDRQEKGPKQRQARSGQLARLTEEIRAPGRRSNRCEGGSSDGGGWPPPQQPCSRHLYNAGQVRLPDGHGLDETSRPGKRRADARWLRGARSFGSLRNIFIQVRTKNLATNACESCDLNHPLSRDAIPLSNRPPGDAKMTRQRSERSIAFSNGFHSGLHLQTQPIIPIRIAC